MELIIHILMLFIVINCSFKLSFWKLWQTVIYSLIAGLFCSRHLAVCYSPVKDTDC